MSKDIKNLIYFILIISTISFGGQLMNEEKNFQPLFSKLPKHSLKKSLNQMKTIGEDELSSFLKDEYSISSKKAKCFVIDEFNVYDISSLCVE